MSVPVIIRCASGVFVVDADGVPVIRIGLLDDPAVPGAPGLDFVEVILLPEEFEIGIAEKGTFLLGEHRHRPWRPPDLASYSAAGSQTMAGVMRMQLSS